MRGKLAPMALGAALAGGLAALAGGIVVFAGLFDVRATTEHSRPVAWAIHRTMIATVRRGARDLPPPPPVTPARIQTGAAVYQAHCAMCHGGPGTARAGWVAGLNPSPPYLVDAARQWTPRELTWIVANGVKMTAMPAWRLSLNPRKIDDAVIFLRALPDLKAADYARITSPPSRQSGSAPSCALR